ncbi:hypothetical protein LTR37_008351 [Vermiconidia calcicola]|uniref:Uncharacterized protein n=1 Tax=Vermiconidia calcicola TaxID=1690605 RepID=A0ACC3NC57_9PEZI|nr:hypothetical protein LTR37_008351 [Vermiconidia calcicola]
MNHHQALRLTPSNSPFFKSSTPKSPTKPRSEEAGLRLKKVIGTTTASVTGFDCLPSARQFAYTAGAAAVVSTIDDDLRVTQRFFRARPTLATGSRELNGQSLATPTPHDARSRAIRDHSVGGSPLGADSPTGKPATAKDRIKAATSVALSPNGKWVAMGETGYKPRILIFPNSDSSSEVPVCALAEHTFGVHALAFSPDSKYLASLGTVNDGFLFIWSLDDRTGAASLRSSNKCTVVINSMTWVNRSLFTIGLRFVKFWRPDEDTGGDRRTFEPTANMATPRHKGLDFGNSIMSPKQKVLFGKNCLLGELIDANFVVAVPISNDRAIVCAQSGEICLVDDCQNTQSLTIVAFADFRISAAAADTESLVVMGSTGKSKRFKLCDLETPIDTKATGRQTTSPSKLQSPHAASTIAMAIIGDTSVELNSRREIQLTRSQSSSEGDAEIASLQLAAHNDAVLGVKQFTCEALPGAAFLSFSNNGSIQVWSLQGERVAGFQAPLGTSPEMYDVTNELRAVAPLANTTFLAAGDKYGTVSVLDVSTGLVVTQVRAHSSEVIDIVAFERSGTQMLATGSRDRTVQLFTFNDGQLELLQTMDEHAAAVNGLLIAEQGNLLLSCSADRTIVIRQAMRRGDKPSAVAFTIRKTMMLKSSPTSMCLIAGHDDVLVSTVDRSIARYDTRSGHAGFTFKCSDTEGGDTAALSKILYAPSLNGNPTVVGVSSSDKSVRLYSEYGALVARDWGHTEGITDVTLLDTKVDGDAEQSQGAQLVTVAADSTIFIWDTASSTPRPTAHESEGNDTANTPTVRKSATPIGPPMRKVLSYTELARFKRESSIDEGEQTSPPAEGTPTHSLRSPPRLKKKTSRMSVAQPPRLEPASRAGFAEPARRRRRSPSTTSPTGTLKRESARKPSLGMSLRSKSSDNVLTTASMGNNSSYGSVNSSTESVCRTLRAYRKKLSNSSTSDAVAPEVLRELEKELKLTARVVGERSQGRNVDEAMVARLLDQASEKIVSRLDERIKERAESEVRRSTEGSPSGTVAVDSPAELEHRSEQMDVVVGALKNVALDDEP